MTGEVSAEQLEAYEGFRRFAKINVAPVADEIDRKEHISESLVRDIAAAGYLGLAIKQRYGGSEADATTQGLLHEALGWASASVQGLVNVHNMAVHALSRWGSSGQREYWLPRLASGELVAAFALTEPQAGSDLSSAETEAVLEGDAYVLNGVKKWITCGQSADVFVLIARCEGQPTAFIVPADSPGFTRDPISGMLGCRGYMMASLNLHDCRIPAENLVGRVGVGVSHVAAAGLDAGRYCLAWGCVGLARACLESSLEYANDREQFGSKIGEHQLIQKKLTEMVVQVDAARLLCLQAGHRREERHSRRILDTAIAKYVASTGLNRTANDAIQIHGAIGCSGELPIARYMRDARIMEVIEGTTQILETMIANYSLQHIDAANQKLRALEVPRVPEEESSIMADPTFEVCFEFGDLDEPAFHQIHDALSLDHVNVKEVSVDEENRRLTVNTGSQQALDYVESFVRGMKRTRKKLREKVVAESSAKGYRYAGNIDADLASSTDVYEMSPGLIGLRGGLLRAFRFFEREFLGLAQRYGADDNHYPVMLPVELLEEMGYFAHFPQQVTFCSHLPEDLPLLDSIVSSSQENGGTLPPELAGCLAGTAHTLKPAVCLPCYPQHRDMVLAPGQIRAVTMQNHVFRYEGTRFRPLARNWDFTVRDLVFFADDAALQRLRREVMDFSLELCRELDLDARLQLANDPFYFDQNRAKSVYQRLGEVKYELCLPIDGDGGELAVSSFNLHRDFYTEMFGIGNRSGDRSTESACMGFGIDRWVYGFVAQKGLEPAKWPERIARACSSDAAERVA